MKPRVLFYCQHVLGMGHMVRSREIVKGLDDFDVCFVNGGEPVDGFAFPPGVRVVQLPPIRSDAEFRDIDASEQLKAERRGTLLELLGRFDPDAVVIEMFPFGRRKFAFELVPLLDEIRRGGGRTGVICSVRDILVGKRDQARHEDQACQLLNKYFDLVLVHSDPRFQELGETFLRAKDIRRPVEYTGFVTESVTYTPVAKRSRRPRLIASAGGGRVGFALLSAVVEASRRLAPARPHDLAVLTGPYLPDDEFSQLSALAAKSPWIQVDRFALDFVRRLAESDLLISMAGYNTCMNILSTGVRAMVYPFTGNLNEEQTIRAKKLERLGFLETLEDNDLHPAQLASRIENALELPGGPTSVQLDLAGVANTKALLKQFCETRAIYV